MTPQELVDMIVGLLNRERSCGRKVRYGSQPTAEKAKLAMERKTGDAFDVYRCIWCRQYHIGHSIWKSG